MSFKEVWAAIQTNANPFDAFGQTAEILEWTFAW